MHAQHALKGWHIRLVSCGTFNLTLTLAFLTLIPKWTDPLWGFTLHIFINVLHNYTAEYHKLVLNAEKRHQILGEMCQGGGKSSGEI